MKKYGESIYGTRGGPFRNGALGRVHLQGQQVYLHISQWTGDRLELPPLKSKVIASICLTSKCPSEGGPDTEGITLTLPAAHQDPLDTVIRLTLSGPASAEMPDGKPCRLPEAARVRHPPVRGR